MAFVYLSKSKLISAWQCAKRLHLEKHRPELVEISSATESLFKTGHEVGAIAQRQYGAEQSVEIPFDRKIRPMLEQTSALLEEGIDFPFFEGTFQHEGVLVRADVMIPESTGWRVIEVKASTSGKDYHIVDCAIQYWVLKNCGVKVNSISLAHINNQFVYEGNGNYEGLLVENDLTEIVAEMEGEVLALLEKARNAVLGPLPDIPVGPHCTTPFECAFFKHCWPMETEFPVTGLRGGTAKLAEMVLAGCRDIRDVEEAALSGAKQHRIHAITCRGEAQVLPGAADALNALPYPRYYLDFETIGPAVPIWPGTRPYSAVVIQWSCHVQENASQTALSDLRHEEFLDLSGEPPMRALAERLIDCLGVSGPVLMYTSYEKTVINNLIQMFPDLEVPLSKIIERLWDLHPVVRDNYYHPKMLGSWSIKAVLPAMVPNMKYSELEGISEGMAASDGFLEAIDPSTSPARKTALETQLLRYCRFDTEAMVEIVNYLVETNVSA